MREPPPDELTERLARLGLATAEQVGSVRGRVRRLARELPAFESVWVDALAQARILTPYQAARINSGEEQRLRIGPYTVLARNPWPGYMESFLARTASARPTRQLWAVRPDADSLPGQLAALERLAGAGRALQEAGLPAVTQAGTDGGLLWAESPSAAGRPAAERLVHYGRLPAEEVWAIARKMAEQLAALERAGLHHGDIGLHALRLVRRGEIQLLAPGLRPIVRPDEGYAFADLAPEAYETLAPERIADGRPSSGTTDRFACGCLWWHLLTGRSARVGGNALAKLQAAHTGCVPDVRTLAPETPAVLAETIARCVSGDPAQRPASAEELLGLLEATVPAACPNVQPSVAVAASRRRARTNALAARLAQSPWTAGAALLTGVAAVAALATLVLSSNPAVPPPASIAGGAAWQASSDPQGPAPLAQNGMGTSGSGERAGCSSAEAIVLPSGRPLAIESMRLEDGQTVRGEGDRPTILVVPPGGLRVTASGVVFENIAFVPPPLVAGEPVGDEVRPLVRMGAARVSFHRCLFRGGANARTTRAVEWAGSDSPKQQSLPSGQVTFRDCVIEGVESAVVAAAPGALGVEMENVLYLGRSAMVVLPFGPTPDAPVAIRLAQTTLRDCGPLVHCTWEGEYPGSLSVRAVGCVLVPREETPLLVFRGSMRPDLVLRNVLWSGEGTILGVKTPVVAWEHGPDQIEPLDDADASMAGLVRSQVDFAATAGEGPAGSQVVRWQAPLRSPDPPGADAARLPPADSP